MLPPSIIITPKVQLTEHFAYTEDFIRCPCCDTIKLSNIFYEHIKLLEELRQAVDFPVSINSGYRCPKHNIEVKGVSNSWHMRFATDIRPSLCEGDTNKIINVKLELLAEAAEDIEFGGIGKYDTFIHLDLRPEPVRWEDRQPLI